MRYYLAPPPLNPVARVLAGLLAIAALVGAFFFGLIILALAAGLGALAWLFLSLRLWWLQRRNRRPAAGQPAGRADRKGEVIEAEYEVLSRREDD